ncbi:17844_t:CDS:2, partial [Cetraspora pellucida]
MNKIFNIIKKTIKINRQYQEDNVNATFQYEHENSHPASHHYSIWIDPTPYHGPLIVTEQSFHDNESNSQDVINNRISSCNEPFTIEQSSLLPSLDHLNNSNRDISSYQSNQFIDTAYNDNDNGSLSHYSNSQETLYEASSYQLAQFVDPIICNEQSLNASVVEQSSCPMSLNIQSDPLINTCDESSNIQQDQFINLNTDLDSQRPFTLLLDSSEVDDSDDETSETINNSESNNVDGDYEYAIRLWQIYNEELNIDNAQVRNNLESNHEGHNQEDLYECNMQVHDNWEESNIVINNSSSINDNNDSCDVMPIQNWNSSRGWDEDLIEQPNDWNEEINDSSSNCNDTQTIRNDNGLSWGVNESPSSSDGDINDSSSNCNDTQTIRNDNGLSWG